MSSIIKIPKFKEVFKISRIYSEEEKRQYLDQYKVSGKSKTEYARSNDIPEATFRSWVKEEAYSIFGVLETSITENDGASGKVVKPIIFASENIRNKIYENHLTAKKGYDIT